MKYIHHIFETGIFSAMIASAIAAVSKYYIPDKDSGVNVGRYPLVTTAKKKVFWQQRHPLPKYYGTYHMTIILKFKEYLGKNETLSLRKLSFKTLLLLVFSTLSRYCLVYRTNQNLMFCV